MCDVVPANISTCSLVLLTRPAHSLLAIVLFACYVLIDFAYDIQTYYSVVLLIILTGYGPRIG